MRYGSRASVDRSSASSSCPGDGQPYSWVLPGRLDVVDALPVVDAFNVLIDSGEFGTRGVTRNKRYYSERVTGRF
jgi:hypothetical protein